MKNLEDMAHFMAGLIYGASLRPEIPRDLKETFQVTHKIYATMVKDENKNIET